MLLEINKIGNLSPIGRVGRYDYSIQIGPHRFKIVSELRTIKEEITDIFDTIPAEKNNWHHQCWKIMEFHLAVFHWAELNMNATDKVRGIICYGPKLRWGNIVSPGLINLDT